jgi:hypothetical protein
MRGQPGSITMLLDLQSVWALDSLQCLADIDLNRCTAGLGFPTALEVRLGLVGPTQLGISTATKVVTTRILASLFNCFAEKLVSFVVPAGEVGMYALTIQFLQQ